MPAVPARVLGTWVASLLKSARLGVGELGGLIDERARAPDADASVRLSIHA